MGVFRGSTKLKLFQGGTKVKKAYLGATKLYSAGNIVTYYVDGALYFQEEADSDASCLAPTTFTPSKSGWKFVGWREDTTASGEVLGSKIMGDEPVALYAVFKQNITLSYKVNGSTSTKTGTRYYNNSNTVNPTFTISNPTLSGGAFKGWSTSASSSSIAYSSINSLSLSADLTVYSVFTYADVTQSINSGNGTVQTFTIYIDNTKYSKITLTSSAENSMCYGILYNPSGGEVINLHTSTALTKSLTSFVSGTYTVEARSNYGYANTTVTITLTGKTVIG